MKRQHSASPTAGANSGPWNALRTAATLPLAAALWLAAALGLAATPALAHSFVLTRALLVLRADRTFQVDVTCDLDALALGVAATTDSAQLAAALAALPVAELERRVAKLERYFERRVRVRFDGTPAPFRVSFPDHGRPSAENPETPTVLGLTARLEGEVPPDAGELTFSASRSFPPVHLTILDETTLGGRRQLLEPGAASTPYRLGEEAGDGDPATVARPGTGVRLETAGRYLALGFRHIVPGGADHVLFVLGLFLLSTRWRPLLWQVSAFTLAHTLTLALATYGLLRLPSSVVEPLIAVSIAYVAIENLLTRELKPWRPLVVFAFGLLHGLGFAGVLGTLGLPDRERLAALLAFNAGVELGQLAVLLAAFAAVGWARHRAWYRRRVVVPLSLAIAVTGLYWAVERILGG